MSTRRVIGIALLAGGIVLLVFGLNASQSFASDVSEAFTGSPTDRSVWMLVSGSVAVIAGGIMALLPGASR